VSVKDFRSILQHAQIITGDLSASYSQPGRPMRLHYSADGIVCEFVLMTVGDKTASLAQKLRKGKGKTTVPGVGLEAANSRAASVAGNNATPAPNTAPQEARTTGPKPASKPPPPHFDMRPPPLPPAQPPVSTLQLDSMFVLQPDEDSQWEPLEQDEEEDLGETARLEWDTSGGEVCVDAQAGKTCRQNFADTASFRRLRYE
jgi:cell cycle checkpoint control protein RAD9A